MELTAWTLLAFTVLLLLMILSRGFFHDYIAGQPILGSVGWIGLFLSVPTTTGVWIVWALLPDASARVPLPIALLTCAALLAIGGLVAGLDVFRALRVLATTDNKTNLLVTIANRLNDVEDYLRILHEHVDSTTRAALPDDIIRVLTDRGVLPEHTPAIGDPANTADGESDQPQSAAAPTTDPVPKTPPSSERQPPATGD